jgi:hypothetical protein
MKRLARLAVVAVALANLSGEGRASADTPQAAPGEEAVAEAAVRYERGTKLYDEGNYAAALAEFRKAYALTRDFHVLYNVAQLCYRLGDYVGSVEGFRAYLDQAGDQITDARRGEVQGHLAELLPRIGSVSVTTNVAGVEIVVDDTPRGTTPLAAPVALSEGQHRLSALKEGKLPLTRTFEVVGAEHAALQLDLVDAVEARPERPEPAPVLAAPAPVSRWTGASYAGLGVAGALAVGSAVTAVLAVNASNQLQNTAYTAPADDDVLSLRTRTMVLRTTADVLGAAALLTLGATLYFTLARGGVVHARASQGPEVGLSPTGAWLSGAF